MNDTIKSLNLMIENFHRSNQLLQEARKDVERLKNENHILQNKVELLEGELDDYESDIDRDIRERGIQSMLGDCLDRLPVCTAWRNEETGAIDTTDFQEWARLKVKSVPDYVSVQGFIAHFNGELRRMHRSECVNAVEHFKGGRNA